jgi:hypothetical protein
MVGHRAEVGRQGGMRNVSRRFSPVVPAKAGTHTPCRLDRLRLHSPSKTGVNALMSGPGSSAGTTLR